MLNQYYIRYEENPKNAKMNYVQTKDELLEQISVAVEQIQKGYTPGQDIINDCEETTSLCKCVDEILHHGLKEGLISWATEPSIWPLLEKITCTEDIEQIKSLNLKSDKEKCSVWTKMAVNLNLLGSYISALHQDKSLLSHYYDYAFLRDPVLTGTVESLLNYGIANFDFQITVDVQRMAKVSNDAYKQDVHMNYDSYNQETKVSGNDNEIFVVGNKERKKKRKKKKQPVNNVVISDLGNDSFDEFPAGLTNGNDESQNDGLGLMADNSYSRVDGCTTSTMDDDTDYRSTTSKTQEQIVTNLGDLQLRNENNFTTSSVGTKEEEKITNGDTTERHEGIARDDADNLGITDDPDEQKRTVFGNDEANEYDMQAQSLEIENSSATTSTSNEGRTEELSENTKAEFRSNDFWLENSSLISSPGKDELDVTSDISKTEPVEMLDEMANSPTTTELNNTNTSQTRDSMNLKKSEKTDSGKYSENDKSSPTEDDVIQPSTIQSPLSYRVKKVENPEFVSSSYSSSYSDVTDMSYDDRDLNFIPGIHSHRRSSSFKSGSSYEQKSSLSFDENGFPVFDSSHFTDSSSRPSSIDGSSGRFTETSNEWDMFDDLLNMEEEHFSGPDNFAGLTTSEELEIAIEHYKKMVRLTTKKSEERDKLVQKLIKLRLRLQQEKEGPPVFHPEIRKVLSHHFEKVDDKSGRKRFCDQCGKIIWVLWQPLFTCKDCGYHCHKKCLDHIQRPCPVRNLSSLSFVLDICPDAGLDAQQYRCAECRNDISISKDGVSRARMCDYTGQYFCDHCHWNDQVCIPARVVHNWDFTQYKVCRQTKQLLDLMKSRPLLNLQQINPMLFRYVEELREVGKLREDILIMKKYFLTCRGALESKLLIQLQKRQHFVDNADSYSLQDLLDLNNDVLLPEISKIHAIFLAHIKSDCQLCRARGFICEVCQDTSDIIFAFDPHAVKCKNCSAVFHKICFKPEDCPKCHRKKKVEEKT